MNKLVQDSEIQILAKVAHRSALLKKANEEELWEKNKEFNIFLRNHLEANSIDTALLNIPQARDILVQTLAKSFVYVPTQEALDRIQAIRDEAYALLPENIQSEKWKPDTCGCEVHAIYQKINGEADMENRQTFHTVPCSEHEGLTHEEIHHTVHNENQLKNLVHKHLIENFEGDLSEKKTQKDGSQILDLKDNIEYKWEWIGKGKDRIFRPIVNEKLLQVDGTIQVQQKQLGVAQKNSIKNYISPKFGLEKINL